MSGWIKLHRKLLENPIVCKDSDHLAVWTYLLLNATHKEYTVVFAGTKIQLQPGQLITGRKTISEKFNISESKVQRILKSFEIDQQIEQQTSNKNRIISILSWADYQDDEQQNEQQVNNKRTTTEQQVNTNKNVKNLKNKRIKELKDIKDITPNGEPTKIKYADFVYLTEPEYQKLSELIGDELEDYFIRFGSWISGQTARVQKSRSAYLSIRNWWREDQKKKVPKAQTSRKPTIPIVENSSSPPISEEELKELRKLAKKFDES